MEEMTKEEFLAGFAEMLTEINDPRSEINTIQGELVTVASDLAPFDPELALRFNKISQAYVELVDYIKSCCEQK